MNHGRFNVSIWELKGVPPLTGDPSAYPTPSAFGRFQVLHQIGAGVLGPVFLARDADRKSYAIKVFRLDITPEQATELAARLSALSRANLGHPSIAAPVSAGVDGSTPYLVQEYVGADSLDAAIRQYGPAPLPQALRILTSVGAALDFAAAVGVFHGSLHPRDLLVTQEDVRVTGVGTGAALEHIGLRGPIRRPYTAPERIQRESWDGRADVYSLGVLAREMLLGTSKRPEPEDGRLAGEQAARVDDIVRRATAARPAERFASALDLVRALQDALSAGAPAPAPGRVPAPPRADRRRGAADLLLPLDEDADEPAPHLSEQGNSTAEDTVTTEAAPVFTMPESDPVIEVPGPAIADVSADFAIPAEPEPLADLSLRGAADDLRPLGDGSDTALDVDVLDAQLPDRGAPHTMSLALEEDENRFADAIEAAPGGVAPAIEFEPDEPAPAAGFGVPTGTLQPALAHDREPAAAARMPRRSAAARLLPFAAVLVLGLALGVLIGYWWGSAATAGQPATFPSDAAAQPSGSAPAVPAAKSAEPASSPASSAVANPAAEAAPQAPESGAPAAKPPVRANGRLSVRSTPRGASVAVNGRARGVTPLRISNLAPGRYTVRVSRRGYATEEREVVLTGDRPTSTLSFSLSRGTRAERPASASSFTGTLAVDSLPAGAKVFVDGKLMGTTPCVLTGIAAGSHVVRVDQLNFKRWAQSVQVRAGGRVRVTASLEREAR